MNDLSTQLSTQLSTTPTGAREDRDGAPHVVYTRTFRAPIEDVWAAATEPTRMERWIGTWSGDPRSGTVDFRMTAEGDDVAVEPYAVDTCEAPRLLVVHSQGEQHGLVWRIRVELDELDGITTLTFSQQMDSAAIAADVGPGWDYYLDRLVVAHAGADAGRVDWSTYETRSPHYRALFS